MPFGFFRRSLWGPEPGNPANAERTINGLTAHPIHCARQCFSWEHLFQLQRVDDSRLVRHPVSACSQEQVLRHSATGAAVRGLRRLSRKTEQIALAGWCQVPNVSDTGWSLREPGTEIQTHTPRSALLKLSQLAAGKGAVASFHFPNRLTGSMTQIIVVIQASSDPDLVNF